MSQNIITPKVFLLLMASAMFVSVWLLPTFLWQFEFLRQVTF